MPGPWWGCPAWLAVVGLSAADPVEQIQLMARVAMAHYQFEALHPSTDSTGDWAPWVDFFALAV